MKFLLLLLLVVVTDGAGIVENLSGKMFTFPVENNRSRVRLTPLQRGFDAATVCLRSFTELTRSHSLFSLATPSSANAFLIFWTGRNLQVHIEGTVTTFTGFDYSINTWHSICVTFNSSSGVTQLWLDGKPSVRKFTSTSRINGRPIIFLGQEQDSHGGDFDINQSFVGMICDVHMWDSEISPCEIKNYNLDFNFKPGNVLNWKALEYMIRNRVLLEEKFNPEACFSDFHDCY